MLLLMNLMSDKIFKIISPLLFIINFLLTGKQNKTGSNNAFFILALGADFGGYTEPWSIRGLPSN